MAIRRRTAVLPEHRQAPAMTELDKDTIAKAYARWAPVYDLVFGAVFERGRHAAIAAAERIGGRILEVGVGTGISLPDYAPDNRLFGIDISEPMLRKAQERVAEFGLSNVEGLAVMDAEKLSFPDGSFDVVVAQYPIRRRRSMSSRACCGRVARSFSSAGSAPRRACDAPSSNGLRPPRGGSDGARSSRGSAIRAGPSARTACSSSSAAQCPHSVISR